MKRKEGRKEKKEEREKERELVISDNWLCSLNIPTSSLIGYGQLEKKVTSDH